MPISVADSGRHLLDADGEPFFFLADTAWNTALKADQPQWDDYLAVRKAQGFTAIEFVTTPWRGCREPMHGALFEETPTGVNVNDAAWAKMEEWLQRLRSHGFTPVPVIFWDNNPDDPFFRRREDTCIAVGQRMLERWSRFDPIWLLAGDGDYRSSYQEARWKRIGQGIFGGFPEAIATLHPCGTTWAGDAFSDQPWYQAIGYQSGHGHSLNDLYWHTMGPHTWRWRDLQKPFINLEPNYELATAFHEDFPYEARHVRRALWWSLLSTPIAGITYGNEPTWVWNESAYAPAEGHGDFWGAGHWRTGLQTEGVGQLRSLRTILERLPWTELNPAEELLVEQPGWTKAMHFQKCAATEDRSTVLAYLPVGGRITLAAELLRPPREALWVDPRTAQTHPCVLQTTRGLCVAEAPDARDWLLQLQLPA
ncbi:MAG: DUF4038 domain-containing protein [Opitutales bacterium]